MRKVIFLSLSLMTLSCAKIDSETSSGSSGLPGASGENVVSVTVKTTWEGDTAKAFPTTHKVCQVTAASPVGTVASCTVQIPESQLYFSNLQMTINANSSYCEFATFNHFYFRLSTAAAYTLPDGTVIDCSDPDAAAGCYFGAVLDQYSDASNTSTYVLPAVTPEISFDYISGNTHRQNSDNYQAFLRDRNVWVVNDLVDLATAQLYVDGGSMQYAGNSKWQDWGIICKDKYYETKYRMNIYLEDINSDTDDFRTWQ